MCIPKPFPALDVTPGWRLPRLAGSQVSQLANGDGMNQFGKYCDWCVRCWTCFTLSEMASTAIGELALGLKLSWRVPLSRAIKKGKCVHRLHVLV